MSTKHTPLPDPNWKQTRTIKVTLTLRNLVDLSCGLEELRGDGMSNLRLNSLKNKLRDAWASAKRGGDK